VGLGCGILWGLCAEKENTIDFDAMLAGFDTGSTCLETEGG